MIIDPTDFLERPYKIPNQEESRDFLSFLEEKEDELGRLILGNDLWEEFNAAVNGSGDLDLIYEQLRDGATYEYNGVTYRYKGWVYTIRPGIYSEWLPINAYKLTNVGHVLNNSPDKSKVLDEQYDFQIFTWNQFVRNVEGYKNSLYGFLKQYPEDYPSWKFQCPKVKNRFDL